MLGRSRSGAATAGSAALRRERDALERLRRELGERLEDVKRREIGLEKRLLRLDAVEPAPPVDTALLRELEERRARLDARSRALSARERDLAERERSLAGREATADRPAELERVLADLDRRHKELAQAEDLFLRTRQELAERSEAITEKEEELLRRERDLEAGGVSSFALPPVDEADDPRPARRRDGGTFSSGLRELQHRGTRRPRLER